MVPRLPCEVRVSSAPEGPRDNQVEDLAPLASQTELQLLLLERNKIGDLASLVNMAKADAEGPKRFAPFLRVYLAGNPLPDATKSSQLDALKAAGWGSRGLDRMADAG